MGLLFLFVAVFLANQILNQQIIQTTWVAVLLLLFAGITLLYFTFSGSLDVVLDDSGIRVFNRNYYWYEIKSARVFRASIEGWDRSLFIDIALNSDKKESFFARARRRYTLHIVGDKCSQGIPISTSPHVVMQINEGNSTEESLNQTIQTKLANKSQ